MPLVGVRLQTIIEDVNAQKNVVFGSFNDRVVFAKRCLQIFTGPPQIKSSCSLIFHFF